MVHTDSAQAKALARRAVWERLANITPARRRVASKAVAERLATLEPIRRGQTVMAFLSLPSEIDTWPFIRWAWSEGKRVAVPRMESPTAPEQEGWATRRMVPVLLEPADVGCPSDHPAVRPGAFGILEVPDAEPIPVAALDVVVAPCQALDRRGHRLGKGGGFYDRFLARLDRRAAVVAIAFQEQVLKQVPVGETDRSVPMIVTDAETIRIGGEDSGDGVPE